MGVKKTQQIKWIAINFPITVNTIAVYSNHTANTKGVKNEYSVGNSFSSFPFFLSIVAEVKCLQSGR